VPTYQKSAKSQSQNYDEIIKKANDAIIESKQATNAFEAIQNIEFPERKDKK
jgi:hypothetical protein